MEGACGGPALPMSRVPAAWTREALHRSPEPGQMSFLGSVVWQESSLEPFTYFMMLLKAPRKKRLHTPNFWQEEKGFPLVSRAQLDLGSAWCLSPARWWGGMALTSAVLGHW